MEIFIALKISSVPLSLSNWSVAMSHKADSVKLRAKCQHPVSAWQCGTRVCKDGIVSPNIVFSEAEAFDYFSSRFGGIFERIMDANYRPMPCGKCAACQLLKRKDWTTRITHEMEMHDVESCCMVTLTYDNEHLPLSADIQLPIIRGTDDVRLNSSMVPTLLPRDVQLFIKRVRRHLEYVPKRSSKKGVVRDHLEPGKLRYFAVGEYGSKTGRPHYHILFFGWCPSDLKYFFTRNGHDIYTSSQIDKIWQNGYSTVQHVGVGCAKYVARYVSKKFGSEVADSDTKRFKEFYLQSCRNGGIGALYFDTYFRQIVGLNYCNVRNSKGFHKASIPDYYKRRLRKYHPDFYIPFRDQRIAFLDGKKVVYDYDELDRYLSCQVVKDKAASENDFF